MATVRTNLEIGKKASGELVTISRADICETFSIVRGAIGAGKALEVAHSLEQLIEPDERDGESTE